MTAHAFPVPGEVDGMRTVRPRARELLFVSNKKFWTMVYWSCLGAIVLSPLYSSHSLWLIPAAAVTSFVFWHLVSVGRRLPWLPGLMAAVACIQWVIAAFVAYEMENAGLRGDMVVPAKEYFEFAVPSTIAYVVGLYLPFLLSRRLPKAYEFRARTANPGLATICKTMVVIGAVSRLVLVPVAPPSLRFAFTLIGNLSLVGALGITVLRPSLWQWWVAGAVAPLALINLRDAQFLELMLWGLFLGVFVIYRSRIGTTRLLIGGVLAIPIFLAINGGKRDYRTDVWAGRMDPTEATSDVTQSLLTYFSSPQLLFSAENVRYNVLRLNEGWITSRLLAWTPSNEPFAKGETIERAVEATLLPRALAPNKVAAGGRETVPRFTGIMLLGATSMNLSIPGEMYANWGLTGAWVGSFVVAFFLGSAFLAIAVRAKRSVFWFAWAPYLFIGAVSAEMGMVEVFNTITKGAITMFALLAVLPTWRRALWPPRKTPDFARSQR